MEERIEERDLNLVYLLLCQFLAGVLQGMPAGVCGSDNWTSGEEGCRRTSAWSTEYGNRKEGKAEAGGCYSVGDGMRPHNLGWRKGRGGEGLQLEYLLLSGQCGWWFMECLLNMTAGTTWWVRRKVGEDLCRTLEIGAGREERLHYMVYYSTERIIVLRVNLVWKRQRRGVELKLPYLFPLLVCSQGYVSFHMNFR